VYKFTEKFKREKRDIDSEVRENGGKHQTNERKKIG